MSGWNKWGIRRKLFSVILLILVLNIVVLLFMGSTLFEWFYQENKIFELKNSAKQIRAAYEQNSETFYDEISQIENENALVSLLSVGENGALVINYHSRAGKDDMRPWNGPRNLPPVFEKKDDSREKKLVKRIEQTDQSFNIQMENSDKRSPMDDSISLSTKLDDNLYLYIQTPRGYIKSTADLAVKYTAFLSIGILLAGSVVIYFVVGRMTKPIQRIQAVADKISHMDFSQKCDEDGGDEIAMLSTSINNMSHELQTSIGRLVEANEVLQNDLVRQQQTDQMRQQFVANVSHDFKTPLTLMISYAEALAEQDLTEVEREYCGIIVGEGNKLSQMVGKLLGLSKLESGIDKAEKSIFCLSEVFDTVIKNHRILTIKRGISVTKDWNDEIIVCADFPKIEQVVTNLFENAVKYTPEGGTITIGTKRYGNKCRVSIENSGDQICEDDLPNLFDSFYRADKSRAVSQSYGLGLAIVKVVMEAHGQAYGVENSSDGVRFWFELELAFFEDDDN